MRTASTEITEHLQVRVLAVNERVSGWICVCVCERAWGVYVSARLCACAHVCVCVYVDVRACIYRICACTSRTFLTIYPQKLRYCLYTEYYVLLATEPVTPVLYVVRLPVETAGVWDCYLASYCTRANATTYYRCIGIFWLHGSSRHHWFPEVEKPWHHWQSTVNAASHNQSAANAIANIFLSHRENLVRLMCELLLFRNYGPKILGAAYTRANTVCMYACMCVYVCMYVCVYVH
jgi:hypothetical protein